VSSVARYDLYPLALWGALLVLTATALFVPTAAPDPSIGPGGKQFEEGRPNGHLQELSPFKREVL